MLEPGLQPQSTEVGHGEAAKKSQLMTDAEHQKLKIETRVDLDMPDLNSAQGKLLLSEALRYTLSNLEIKQKTATDDIEAIRDTQSQIDGDTLDLVYQFSRLDQTDKLDGLVVYLEEKVDPHQAGRILFSEEPTILESLNKRAKQMVEQEYVNTEVDAVLLLKSIYKASVYKLVGSTLLRDLKEFTTKKEQIPEMIEKLKADAQQPV